jgi:uncharacterized protein
MRRKDKEITDRAEIEAILDQAPVLRIALAENNQPYVVPVCFGHEPGVLYFHSSTEGKKIAMIRANPRVCFEVDLCDGVVKGERACSWGMRYRSVIGFGRASILTAPAEKKHGLTCIMRQYRGGIPEFSDEDVRHVAVIRIAIESMTGKKKE